MPEQKNNTKLVKTKKCMKSGCSSTATHGYNTRNYLMCENHGKRHDMVPVTPIKLGNINYDREYLKNTPDGNPNLY